MIGDGAYIDYSASHMMARHHAELYQRIYQYAAQDFRAVTDCLRTHQGIVARDAQMNAALATIKMHTHMVPQSPSGTLPSLPPTEPNVIPATSKPPISTTGVPENQAANRVIPSAMWSYLDLRVTALNRNVATPVLRRQMHIPILVTPTFLNTAIRS